MIDKCLKPDVIAGCFNYYTSRIINLTKNSFTLYQIWESDALSLGH